MFAWRNDRNFWDWQCDKNKATVKWINKIEIKKKKGDVSNCNAGKMLSVSFVRLDWLMDGGCN